jgi:hypothetical protein
MSWLYTVTKAKRDTGAQHAGDGKFRHPRREIGKIINTDWTA